VPEHTIALPYCHPSSHSIMKLTEDVDKLSGASEPEEDFPQEIFLSKAL